MHEDIYYRAPIDRLAATVTSQKEVTDDPLTRDQILEIYHRLQRKQRLLKQFAGIRNRVHQNNVKKRFKARGGFEGNNPRLLKEYFANGLSIQSLAKELNA